MLGVLLFSFRQTSVVCLARIAGQFNLVCVAVLNVFPGDCVGARGYDGRTLGAQAVQGQRSEAGYQPSGDPLPNYAAFQSAQQKRVAQNRRLVPYRILSSVDVCSARDSMSWRR